MKKRFTEEQIIKTLREQESEQPTAEVCRRQGISPATFYKWKAKFGGMDVSDARRLKVRTARVSPPPDQIGVARVPACRRRFQVAMRAPEYRPLPRVSGPRPPRGRYSPRLPCLEIWQSRDDRRGPGPRLLAGHRRAMSRVRGAGANLRRCPCRSRRARPL